MRKSGSHAARLYSWISRRAQRVLRLMPGINGITASAERKIAVHCNRNVLKERHQPAASKGFVEPTGRNRGVSQFPQMTTRLVGLG
jgi:peptidyl-tRNA hydrolase